MRTKLLLLTAALAAAGTLASNAQVYSVNAVGYVNKTVTKNTFALLSNPLNASNNSVSNVLANVPDGTALYMWDTGTKSFKIDSFDSTFGGWQSLGSSNVNPGSGFFIKAPADQDVKLTFVGEVPQGTGANALTTPLVPGFQIVSSQVPQAGTLTDLGYTVQDQDTVYQFDTTKQGYNIFAYDATFGSWSPDLKPVDVGEAVFLNTQKAGTWTRSFTVNQ